MTEPLITRTPMAGAQDTRVHDANPASLARDFHLKNPPRFI